MPDSDLRHVRDLFERQSSAVLCTAHAGLAGWPYGSIVPYAMLPNGDLVVFVSDIAEHTQNLRRSPRATVFLADPSAAERPQSGPRHAMLVRAVQPRGDDEARAEACYFARFPDAASMREAHGFAVWVLECERIRWIAGFGSMGWIDRAAWTGEADALAPHAASIVAHLNDDHADALKLLAALAAGAEISQATAVSLDRGGLDLRAVETGGAERALRLPFEDVAATPDDVRRIVVAMVRRARAASDT